MGNAVLALDIGTSSTRASLYDLNGRHLRGQAARIAYTPTTTADGGAEFDPDVLFEDVCTVIDEVLRDTRADIVGVGTSTFWHSLLGLDRRGQPLTPVYLWMDARSRQDAAQLRARLDERAVHARVGCMLHWSYWPAKLSWLQRTQPAVFKRVQHWIAFDELILRRLCGQTGMSVSMASGTGLLDAHTCAWDRPLLEVIRVRLEQMPRLQRLSTTAVLGEAWARRWPKLRTVPWVLAIGDGAASNLGSGCATAERFALMIGTSGAERVVWLPPEPFEIPAGTWCYRIDERRTVLGGALNDGGSLFDWLRRAVRLPSVRKAEAAVAAMEPDAHGLTVLPFWAGERSPGWADDARGVISGLRLHTRPEDILRAGLEAVALRFGELDRSLLQAMPTGNNEVVATGGALLHSPAWMQIMADVLGRPVLASSELEASSRGAGLLALETLGRLAKPMEELRPTTRRRYEPVAEHTERYRAAAERQRGLYDLLVRR